MLYLKLLSKEDALHTPVHTRNTILIPYTMLWSDIINHIYDDDLIVFSLISFKL